MAHPKPVFVSPDGSSWVVQQGGRILSKHHLKDRALESGRREARADRTELIEQNRKGVIVSKDSFGNESQTKDREH